MKKNETNNRLLITQQEMILIKNSEEAKKGDIYGNLYECLLPYKNLALCDLNKNPLFNDKSRAVLISWDNKQELMRDVKKEWISLNDYDIADVKMNCQLCGRPNIIICYIKNIINGTELHIGSDCVQNFTDIDGVQQQYKKMTKQKRERDKQIRKIEFEALEENDINFLQNSENAFLNFPIMLPYSLHHAISNTLAQLKDTKNSYINRGGNIEEVFKTYNLIKVKYNELYKKAEFCYEKTKNNKLVCPKYVSDWLVKNYPIMWEKISKNNGFFAVETLQYIHLQLFIQNNIASFSQCLSDPDIKILQIEESKIKFSIKNRRYSYPIIFSISTKEFMKTIGCHCLTDANYKYDRNDLQRIEIDVSQQNCFAFYNSVSDILKEKGYDFIIEEKTQQAFWKQLPYYENKQKGIHYTGNKAAIYKKSSIGKFLETITPFLLKDECDFVKNFDYIKKKMECGNIWITQRDKDFSEQISREARGYQKQRQFTPY